MSVSRVDKDFDNLTLTVVAHFSAPIERVWQLWADPRLLERWWGPPTHPATFQGYDLTPGGTVTYVMAGPDGERSHGWWRITSVDAPTALEFVDGFADRDGIPVPGSPTVRVQVQLAEREDGTQMEVRSVFGTLEHMERLADLGAMEIFVRSIETMDTVLADPPS